MALCFEAYGICTQDGGEKGSDCVWLFLPRVSLELATRWCLFWEMVLLHSSSENRLPAIWPYLPWFLALVVSAPVVLAWFGSDLVQLAVLLLATGRFGSDMIGVKGSGSSSPPHL